MLSHPYKNQGSIRKIRRCIKHDRYTWNNSWIYIIAQKRVWQGSIIFWRRHRLSNNYLVINKSAYNNYFFTHRGNLTITASEIILLVFRFKALIYLPFHWILNYRTVFRGLENSTKVSIFLSLRMNFSHDRSFVTCPHCGNRVQVPFNYVRPFFHANVI